MIRVNASDRAVPSKASLEPASVNDLGAVLTLASTASLPTQGISEQFPRAYAVARAGQELLAVAGLERYGHFGLLRTVVVAPDARGKGLARLLVENRLQAGREQGMAAVYLLTTTAPEYFRRLGFREIPRTQAPAELQASSEFASICPSSATCLARELL